MADPAATGARVLAGLAAGRLEAIRMAREQAEHNERVVRRALDLDILAGHRQRGRAVRIARAVRGKVSVHIRENVDRDWITPRGVQKILARLSSGADSTRHSDST